MVDFLYIVAGIAFVAFVIAGIWLLTIIFREKKEQPDSTLLLNFMSHKSNGRFMGIETNTTPSKNNRIIVEYQAGDLNWNKVLKTKEDINAKVIIPQNKVISIPKGALSQDKNINIYPPINPEDLHPALKNTVLGVALMAASELKNFETLTEQVLREGTDRRDALLKKIGDGELSREFMKHFEGYVKDFMEATVNMKGKDKDSSIPGVGVQRS